MAGGTEFDVHAWIRTACRALPRAVYMYCGTSAPDEAWVVQTPRGLVKHGSGRYGIVVGTTDTPRWSP